jgi:hypothetical protein
MQSIDVGVHSRNEFIDYIFLNELCIMQHRSIEQMPVSSKNQLIDSKPYGEREREKERERE